MKKLKQIGNKRGFTLVEAIVGATLIVICGLILVSGFSAAGSLIRKGMDITKSSQQAAEAIEANTDLNTAPGSFSFDLNGTSVTVPGNYNSAAGSTEPIYSEFVPNY